MSSIAKKYSKRNGDTTIMDDNALQLFVVWNKTNVVWKKKKPQKIAIL